jgi:hypothetical protein
MKMSEWLHDMNPKAALASAARFQKKMEPHLKRYEAAKGAGWQPIATVPVNFPVLVVLDGGPVGEHGERQGWQRYSVWAGIYMLYEGKRKPVWVSLDDDKSDYFQGMGTPVFWMAFPNPPAPA